MEKRGRERVEGRDRKNERERDRERESREALLNYARVVHSQNTDRTKAAATDRLLMTDKTIGRVLYCFRYLSLIGQLLIDTQ